MANFGSLAAEIVLGVWGTTTNFNGFRVLASLLQRRRSSEANQTLHDVWTSPGLLHYIYTFGGSCHLTKFRHVQNSLCVQVLRSPILAALLYCDDLYPFGCILCKLSSCLIVLHAAIYSVINPLSSVAGERKSSPSHQTSPYPAE